MFVLIGVIQFLRIILEESGEAFFLVCFLERPYSVPERLYLLSVFPNIFPSSVKPLRFLSFTRNVVSKAPESVKSPLPFRFIIDNFKSVLEGV